MSIQAQVLADSVSPQGVRLTTLSVTYPRIIHAEMLRHRVMSRCAASSRAIPVSRFIEQVVNDTYLPKEWGSNQKGMSAGANLCTDIAIECENDWIKASNSMVVLAMSLRDRGVHKQITNRLLEPFQWMTEIISSTEWGNFFHRRIHPAAHPDIQATSKAMFEALESSRPEFLCLGEWHMPLVTPDDVVTLKESGKFPEWEDLSKALRMISVGRVARVSYLRHEDTSSAMLDLERANNMLANAHMSPFEHVARPINLDTDDVMVKRSIRFPVASDCWGGNFRGWWQLRKTIPFEDDMPSDVDCG